MTDAERILLIIAAVVLGTLLLLLDAFLVFGLSFTSHFPYDLVLTILSVGAFDLPGMVVGIWRPKWGAAILCFGAVAFLFCWFLFIRQIPTLSVTVQGVCVAAPKLLLAFIFQSLARRKKSVPGVLNPVP
jgi:hypothetical protein